MNYDFEFSIFDIDNDGNPVNTPDIDDQNFYKNMCEEEIPELVAFSQSANSGCDQPNNAGNYLGDSFDEQMFNSSVPVIGRNDPYWNQYYTYPLPIPANGWELNGSGERYKFIGDQCYQENQTDLICTAETVQHYLQNTYNTNRDFQISPIDFISISLAIFISFTLIRLYGVFRP